MKNFHKSFAIVSHFLKDKSISFASKDQYSSNFISLTTRFLTCKRFSRTPFLPLSVNNFCLIRNGVDPIVLSGLGKIRSRRIEIICIGRDRDIPICPV